MSTRSIISSTSWQMASQLVMAALSVATVKFVAVGLSKELAGNYNSAYGFLQLFGIVADFGLYAVSVRELAKAQDKPKVLGGLIALRTLITFASLGLAIVLVWMSPAWRGTLLPIGVTIAATVPLFTLLAGILRSVFQVTYKMQYVFISEVTQRIITAALIGLIVLSGVRASDDPMIYKLFLGIGGLGACVLLILSIFFAKRLMPLTIRSDWSLTKTLLKASLPYGIAFLCVALYRQFDLTLIALLREDYAIQNAYYGFVGRITEMTYLLPTFLLNSTLPLLSQRADKDEDTSSMLGKTFLLILLLGSISMLFSFFWARPLVLLLTTDAYLSTATNPGSDTALQLLSLPMFLNGITLYSFYVLLTKHRWKKLVITMLGGVIVSIGLNVFLIPIHGFVGAAFTAIIVNALMAIFLFPQAQATMRMNLPMSSILRWLAFSVILGTMLSLTAGLLTSENSIVMGMVLATVGMGVVGWMLGLQKVLLK